MYILNRTAGGRLSCIMHPNAESPLLPTDKVGVEISDPEIVNGFHSPRVTHGFEFDQLAIVTLECFADFNLRRRDEINGGVALLNK